MRCRRAVGGGLAIVALACGSPNEAAPVPAAAEVVSAGPAAPPDSVCEPRTSAADLDAVIEAQVAATLAATPRGAGAERAARGAWDYLRPRVLSGALVLDVAGALACARALGGGDGTSCHGPWVHARCATPEGSPCGRSEDCDVSMWCETEGMPAFCQRTGHCRLRTAALGEPCESDSCAPASAPSVRRECWIPGAPGSRCLDVESRVVGHGEACHGWTDATGPSWVTRFAGCPEGDLCIDGTCQAAPTPAAYLESCGMIRVGDGRTLVARTCGPGLACDTTDRLCHSFDELHCAAGPFPAALCPASDASGAALACVNGVCVATDGSRGAPCDPGMPSSDCGTGLACHSDGRCGDLLPNGSACSVAGELYGTECASRCCAGDALDFLHPGVCVSQPL